jgi:hypothetical protein
VYTEKPKILSLVNYLVGGACKLLIPKFNYSLLVLGVFTGVILSTSNVGLITFSAFIIGFWIQLFLNFIVHSILNFVCNNHIKNPTSPNYTSIGTKIYGYMLLVMGVFAAVATGMGDYIQYMNRDI